MMKTLNFHLNLKSEKNKTNQVFINIQVWLCSLKKRDNRKIGHSYEKNNFNLFTICV